MSKSNSSSFDTFTSLEEDYGSLSGDELEAYLKTIVSSTDSNNSTDEHTQNSSNDNTGHYIGITQCGLGTINGKLNKALDTLDETLTPEIIDALRRVLKPEIISAVEEVMEHGILDELKNAINTNNEVLGLATSNLNSCLAIVLQGKSSADLNHNDIVSLIHYDGNIYGDLIKDHADRINATQCSVYYNAVNKYRNLITHSVNTVKELFNSTYDRTDIKVFAIHPVFGSDPRISEENDSLKFDDYRDDFPASLYVTYYNNQYNMDMHMHNFNHIKYYDDNYYSLRHSINMLLHFQGKKYLDLQFNTHQFVDFEYSDIPDKYLDISSDISQQRIAILQDSLLKNKSNNSDSTQEEYSKQGLDTKRNDCIAEATAELEGYISKVLPALTNEDHNDLEVTGDYSDNTSDL